MITIIIQKSTPVRLFDRMPLPKATKNLKFSKMVISMIKKRTNLKKYITNPFVRRISKIA